MASLSFKKAYIEPIVQGHKTATLRARKPRFDVGDRIAAFCQWGRPAFAELLCTDVEQVQIAELTDRVARADGFESAAALRDELAQLYPGETVFWLIRFQRLRERS